MKKFLGVAVVMAASGVAHAAPVPTGTKPVAKGSSVTAAAEALSRGDTLEALTRADEALRADPKNAWAHYNRAAALAALNRIDEAVAAYDEAAGKFGKDQRGKTLSLWGKAHVLYRTGRCDQASQAFADYTRAVGSSDPTSVELASHRASTCRKGGAESEATALPTTKAEATTVAGTPAKPEAETKSALPSLAKPEAEPKVVLPAAKP